MASDFSIRHAAHIIKNGGIIAYPTDTVYGLGCDPYNELALEKINAVKQRPTNKQFILLVGELQQIRSLISITPKQESKINACTEPTSWIINASSEAPAWLTHEDNTLTIRVSNNSTVKKLCLALGHAIISTSANISGQQPATNALDIRKYFGTQIDKILAPVQKPNTKPSKIIQLCDNRIIRN